METVKPSKSITDVQPKVIGQGSYGCVHKPQLTCKNKTRKGKKLISKLLSKKNAIGEIQEYQMISNADKQKQIYLGKPANCNVEDNELNRIAIKNCNNDKFIPTNIDNYALLVMKDGGQNLEQFANDVFKNWKNTPDNQHKIELFWLEVSRLFYGLKVFHDNNIVHHDLKPQNIVYNQKNNRLNFIDFGLMRKKQTILTSANASEYWLAEKNHWSFPWEIVLLNKASYRNRIPTFSKQTFHTYMKHIKTECEYFFHSVFPVITKPSEEAFHSAIVNNMFNEYYVMLDNLTLNEYTKFINKSIDTIDSYGVGIALLYVLHRTGKFIDNNLFEKLLAFFVNMISPTVYKRFDTEQLLSMYETIMIESGLLHKYNKLYSNHLLVTGNQIPLDVRNDIYDIVDDDFIVKAHAISDKMPEEKLEIKRLCPDGKEFKQNTKRCVKLCKDGYIRNVDFKCVKDANARKTYKKCPSNKQRNPFTNRCVKDCKPGYLRDETYKCQKGVNPFD
jgi:serine/threonine protein kinase